MLITAHRAGYDTELKNLTERLHNAHDVTTAYRVARARRAFAYESLEREPYSDAAALAFAALTAADMQLDAAIHTEQSINKELMELKELGRKAKR